MQSSDLTVNNRFATISVVPLFIGLNDGISVTSVWSGRPIEAPPVISKTRPEGVPVKGTGSVANSAQYCKFVKSVVTVGAGSTVTVAKLPVVVLVQASPSR